LLIVRDSKKLEPLLHGELIGVVFDFFAGMISAVAAIYVLFQISRRLHKEGWSNWDALHVSVTALFVAEFILGVGHAMSLKWAIQSKVYTGTFCTAQGVMRQMGGTAVALTTLTIAVQTFLSLYWVIHLYRTLFAIVIGVEYLFVILFVAIGFGTHTHPPKEYYAVPTPFWCWIGDGFRPERISGEYAWLWVALFGSFLLYIPLFLMHFEIVKPGNALYLPASIPRAPSEGNDMLWSTILYPVLYCVLVLPLSIVRWIGFENNDTTKGSHHLAAWTLIVAVIFGLSGVANAILYLTTRKPFFHPNTRDGPA